MARKKQPPMDVRKPLKESCAKCGPLDGMPDDEDDDCECDGVTEFDSMQDEEQG